MLSRKADFELSNAVTVGQVVAEEDAPRTIGETSYRKDPLTILSLADKGDVTKTPVRQDPTPLVDGDVDAFSASVTTSRSRSGPGGGRCRTCCSQTTACGSSSRAS